MAQSTQALSLIFVQVEYPAVAFDGAGEYLPPEHPENKPQVLWQLFFDESDLEESILPQKRGKILARHECLLNSEVKAPRIMALLTLGVDISDLLLLAFKEGLKLRELSQSQAP